MAEQARKKNTEKKKLERIIDEVSLNKTCELVYELKNGGYVKDDSAKIKRLSKTEFCTASRYSIRLDDLDRISVSFYDGGMTPITFSGKANARMLDHQNKQVVYECRMENANNPYIKKCLTIHTPKKGEWTRKCIQ